MDKIKEIPSLVKQLYEVTERLEYLFEGRHFTPDGHLVGSIGEVLAAYHYDLELSTASTEGYDAISRKGKKIQIKATQVSRVAMRSEPEHLIVLKINQDGTDSEVFNGPGKIAWSESGKMQSNGQRGITLSKLKKLMDKVQSQDRIARVNG